MQKTPTNRPISQCDVCTPEVGKTLFRSGGCTYCANRTVDKIESNQSCIAPLCSDMNKKQLFIVLQLSQRQNLSKTLTAAEDEMERCWLEARLQKPPFPGEYNVLNGL